MSSCCELEITGEPASYIKSGHAIIGASLVVQRLSYAVIIHSLGVCGCLWLLEPLPCEAFKKIPVDIRPPHPFIMFLLSLSLSTLLSNVNSFDRKPRPARLDSRAGCVAGQPWWVLHL